MRHEQQSTQVGTPNDYTYNGKELNDDFDLNLHDYGARWYDASIGRWHSVDPLAESFSSLSPYHYGLNNPIYNIDPTGMASEPYTYNWDAERYEDGDGNEVGWNEVHNHLKNTDSFQEHTAGMAILIAYPEDEASVRQGSFEEKALDWDGDGKLPYTGHAGIVIINAETGATNYFDFGRYNRPDVGGSRGAVEGAVRSSKNYSGLSIPNWNFNKSDEDNVKAILTRLHASSLLHGYGEIEGALATSHLNYDEMLAKARELEGEGYIKFGGYHTPSSMPTYCAKFARTIFDAGYTGYFNPWSFYGYNGHQNVKGVSRKYGTPITSIGGTSP